MRRVEKTEWDESGITRSTEKTMNRRILVIFAALFALSAYADQRLEPMDFYIVYDRSLSMRLEGKAQDSKNWLIGSFIGPVVIPGDNVYLISFYRKAETVWDGPVKSEADKKELMRKVTALKPNGIYTDIGIALDALKTRLEASLSDARKKYILLLTDEIQEAPPSSPYFSPDGRFAHAYLTYVRREAHGAWKVITIGVGIGDKVESSVKELESVITALPAERLKNADPRLITAEGEGKTVDGGSEANETALSSLLSPAFLLIAGAVVLSGLVLAIVLLARKRVRSRQDEKESGDAPSDGDSRRG
jgi:hypothetical protein